MGMFQKKRSGDFERIRQQSPASVFKTIGIGIGVFFVLILALNTTYQIREQEQAVLTTFGKAEAVTTPGLHFKIPFVQNVTKVDTTIQGFSIGYDQTTDTVIEEEAIMITSDYNFIDVDFFVEYKVSDPVKALYASEDPVAILKNMTQGCIRTVIGSYNVDDVLTTGKSEIQAKIKEMIMVKLNQQDIGIQLVNITIQDSEPPTAQIMEAFKKVETAKQQKETAINEANKYRNEQIPKAEADADAIIKNAEAYKQERINEATGQVARFEAMYAEYIKNPMITKQRMFYEAMEEVLPDLKLIIDSSDGDGVQKILPLESFSGIETNVSGSASSETTESEE